MKKNEIFDSLKIIVLGLILSFGFSFVMAGSWNPPSGTPLPSNNEIGPINAGNVAQSKAGALALGKTTPPITLTTLDVEGTARSTGLLVEGRSYLIAKTIIGNSGVVVPGSSGSVPTGGAFLDTQDKIVQKENLTFFEKIAQAFNLKGDKGNNTSIVYAAETPGDINNDGLVDEFDLLPTDPCYGVSCTPPEWCNAALGTPGVPYTGQCVSTPCSIYNPCPYYLICQSGACVLPTSTSVGVCGTADGSFYATTPSAGLCSAGYPSSVTGSGTNTDYWKWSCGFTAPGTVVNCSANLDTNEILEVYGNSRFSGSIMLDSFSGLPYAGAPTYNAQNRPLCIDEDGKIKVCTL